MSMIIRALCVLVAVAMSVVAQTSKAVDLPRMKWKVISVSFLRSPDNQQTTAKSSYQVSLENSGPYAVSQVPMELSYPNLLALCKIQRVGKPENLVGTTFLADPGVLPDETLRRRIFKLRFPRYKAPTAELLYTRLQESVANLECPDFSDQDPQYLDRIFHDVYSLGSPETNTWFQNLVAYVNRVSNRGIAMRIMAWPGTNRPPIFGDEIMVEASQAGKVVVFGLDPLPDGPTFHCFVP